MHVCVVRTNTEGGNGQTSNYSYITDKQLSPANSCQGEKEQTRYVRAQKG